MVIYAKDSNKSIGKDNFGVHTKIAQTISEIIQKTSLEDCSLNIGLFGKWGSGKSFIVDKIKNELPKDKYVFLNIDVWKFIGNPLLRSILFDINKQLQVEAQKIFPKGYMEDNNDLESILYYEKELKEEIALSMGKFYKKLKNLFEVNKFYLSGMVILFIIALNSRGVWLSKIGAFGDFLKGLLAANSALLGLIVGIVGFLFYPFKKLGELLLYGIDVHNYKILPNFSPEQFERIFLNITKNITEANLKLVIVFDNLDRCEPKYAYETLSTIKTFMDVPNCVYIVPCDDKAVKNYIANDYFDEENFRSELCVEFFDKLFDTFIRIPELQEIDRDNFINGLLRELDIYDNLKHEVSNIRQILYYGYKGLTPRQIKKFVNDFSTYYLLAENIDPEKKFLLKNISLFAIMMVIKQKWNHLESILVEKPMLINNPKITKDNDKEYYNFISKVSPLIPYPLPSLLPFIYLKETPNEQTINSKLRNGEIVENIEGNIYKRIKIEIENINGEDQLYLLNALKSLLSSINVPNNPLPNQIFVNLVKIMGFAMRKLDETNFAIFIAQNKKFIDFIYNNIQYTNRNDKEIIKSKIISYLQSKDVAHEVFKLQLFKLIINDTNSLISNAQIHQIFSKISDINQILNTIFQKYILLAFEDEKGVCIPEHIIDLIIGAVSHQPMSEHLKNFMLHFKSDQLSIKNKQNLINKLESILKEYSSPNSNYYAMNANVAQNRATNILLCLKLVSGNDFSQEQKNTIIQNIINLAIKMKSSTDSLQKKLACRLMIELVRFVDATNEQYNKNLENLIAVNIQVFIDCLAEVNFSYIKSAFSNDKIKGVFLSYPEVVKFVYEKFIDYIPNNYEFLLGDVNAKENLKIMINLINEKKLSIDGTSFKNNIITKYTNLGDVSQTVDIIQVLDEYGYKITSKQLQNIKNSLIDLYKKDKVKGLEKLGIIKGLMPEEEFSKYLLVPIFKYIDSELDNTNDTSSFLSIITILNNIFIKENLILLDEIIKKLSEDGQASAEYELCLHLIKQLKMAGFPVDKYKEKLEERIETFNEDLSTLFDELYPRDVDKHDSANANN